MISIEEIDKTILELEAKDTTYAVIERLAWLYTVKDHIQPRKEDLITQVINYSEFTEICSNKPYNSVMSVLSEHFELIKAIYPREYTAIIEKIKAL